MKRLPILLVLLAGACGEVAKLQPDGDSPDAAIDASPNIDANLGGPVHVHVLTFDRTGAPDLSTIVVMQDHLGAMTADGPVDGNGNFTGPLPAEGGTVTVIRKLMGGNGVDVNAQISTVTGVMPEETIEFGLQLDAAENTTGVQQAMTLNFQPLSPSSGVTFYTQCGQQSAGTTPIALQLYSTCHGSTFDVFASGTDPNNTNKFQFVQNVPFQNNGTASIPALSRLYSTFEYTLKNVPAGLTTINASRSSVVGNLAVDYQSGQQVTQPAGGTIPIQVPYAAVAGLKGDYEIDFTRTGSPTRQAFAGRSATNVASESVDMAQQTLPWIADGTFSATQTGFQWQVSTPGGGGDAMAPVWFGSWTLSGGTKYTVAWRITTPWNDTGYLLPHLPTKYAEFDPQAQTATVTVQVAQVSVVDYDQVPDYATFRLHHDQLLTDSQAAARLFGPTTGFAFRRAATTTSGR